MSSPVAQIRTQDAADRRGRRRAGPAHRRTAPPHPRRRGCRSSRWSRWCCSAASSGCCCSTPRCSRRRSPPPRSRARPTRSPPASRRCRWTSTGCATRSGSPTAAQRLGMVPGLQRRVPRARHRRGGRRAVAGDGSTPFRIDPLPPKKPAAAEPGADHRRGPRRRRGRARHDIGRHGPTETTGNGRETEQESPVAPVRPTRPTQHENERPCASPDRPAAPAAAPRSCGCAWASW